MKIKTSTVINKIIKFYSTHYQKIHTKCIRNRKLKFNKILVIKFHLKI